MKRIEIYTTPICLFCREAKNLLMAKNVHYIEIDVSDPIEREKMIQRVKGKTSVPQIFVEGKLIGGCDDIYTLESKGHLDEILGV